MGKSGFLPRRWRRDEQAVAHLEAIAHVLDTAPLTPVGQGLAIFAEVGSASVLPLLVASKSLTHRLGRGRFVICADSTLTGADRTILAHHLGDPELVVSAAREFPRNFPWGAIVAAMKRRRGEYCMALSPCAVTVGAVPQIDEAIAANRSLASAAFPGALMGFAAGGPPPPDPGRFAAALGEDHSRQAQQALLMAREISPVSLGRELAMLTAGGTDLTAASCAAIAALG